MRAGPQLRGGPSGAELFELPLVALNTAFLLVSSITYGFAMLAAQKKNVKGTLSGWPSPACWAPASWAWNCTSSPPDPRRLRPVAQGFLTAFFSLVGTHGLHVTFGIVWLSR
jgi:cytochrome o ubiquinol oxidase subunit 3